MANDDKMPPQMVAYWDTPLSETQYQSEEPWQGYLCWRDSNFDEPMQLAALYVEGIVETAEIFYCNSQYKMLSTGYEKDYTYKYYTAGGAYEWGTYIPPPDWHIRASYNYWMYGKQRLDELHATKAIVVDNLQQWRVVPHRKNAQEPLGVNALFADGHVNFCKGPKIFDKQLWNPNGNPNDPIEDWVWNDGPGDNRPAFDEILRRLSGF